MNNLNKFQLLLAKINKGEIDLHDSKQLKTMLQVILQEDLNSQDIHNDFKIEDIIFTYKHKLNTTKEVDNNFYIFCITMHEILIRSLREKIINKNIFAEWINLIKYLQLIMGYELVEQFRLIMLDAKHRFIKDHMMTKGTIDQASVYIREIIVKAIEYNAKNIIIAHNHPSGDCSPSGADQFVTNQVLTACHFNKIYLVDHLIITKYDYFSFKNENRLI